MKIKDFKLEEYLDNYEFSAPYLLCTSDCESFSVGELLALDKDSEERLKKLRLSYTETQGNLLLREEISKLYKDTNSEDILVFSGAEEGIFVFMNVHLEEGDHIIVQFPAYQSLFEIANSIGCEITNWSVDDQNNWELDLDFLKNNIRENTKAIILNCPHNPTGYLMSNEKLNLIVDIAKNNGIYVFSDEVYRYMEYNESDRLSAMCDIYEKGLSLGVMSKTFGLPGLRIGWIATKDKTLLKQLKSFKNYTTICNSALSEFFSIVGLKNKDFLIKRNLEIIEKNLILLDEFFDKYSNYFSWVKPKAGSIAFPQIKFNKTSDEFCLDVLNKKGVLLLPSTNFNYGDRNFRIGFGKRNMPQALSKLEEYVQEELLFD